MKNINLIFTIMLSLADYTPLLSMGKHTGENLDPLYVLFSTNENNEGLAISGDPNDPNFLKNHLTTINANHQIPNFINENIVDKDNIKLFRPLLNKLEECNIDPFKDSSYDDAQKLLIYLHHKGIPIKDINNKHPKEELYILKKRLKSRSVKFHLLVQKATHSFPETINFYITNNMLEYLVELIRACGEYHIDPFNDLFFDDAQKLLTYLNHKGIPIANINNENPKEELYILKKKLRSKNQDDLGFHFLVQNATHSFSKMINDCIKEHDLLQLIKIIVYCKEYNIDLFNDLSPDTKNAVQLYLKKNGIHLKK